MTTPFKHFDRSLFSYVAIFAIIMGCASYAGAQSLNQIEFSNRTNLLGPRNFSGVAMAVADMNGDGRDDIVRYNQGQNLNIQYQQGPRDFFRNQSLMAVSNASQWGNAIADVDQDGLNDIIVGGAYDNLKLIRNGDGAADYLSLIHI